MPGIRGTNLRPRAGRRSCERLYLDPPEPDLGVFDFDGNFPPRQRNVAARIRWVRLLEPGNCIHRAAIDDVRCAVTLPQHLNRVPVVQHFKVPVLDLSARAWLFRARPAASPVGIAAGSRPAVYRADSLSEQS